MPMPFKAMVAVLTRFVSARMPTAFSCMLVILRWRILVRSPHMSPGGSTSQTQRLLRREVHVLLANQRHQMEFGALQAQGFGPIAIFCSRAASSKTRGSTLHALRQGVSMKGFLEAQTAFVVQSADWPYQNAFAMQQSAK